MSSSTTSRGRTSTSVSLRRTRIFASEMTDSLASVLLARYSWMMPISVLMTMTNPNSASWKGATISITIHMDPIRALK